MRISGLASGIDTDTLVKELMAAHRKPLEKIYQQKEFANWKIDAYREVNTKLLEFRKSMEDLRLEGPYNSSIATSSNPSTVVATSTGGFSTQSSYEITSVSLAQTERAASVKFFTGNGIVDPATTKLIDIGLVDGESLTINDKTFTVGASSTMNDLVAAFADSTEVNVFYSATEKSLTITNKFKGSSSSVSVTASTSLQSLNIKSGTVNSTSDSYADTDPNISSIQGRDKSQASAIINGIEYRSDTNSITFDGIQFDLKASLDPASTPISVTSIQDDEKIFEKIKTFIDGYNKLIEDLNNKISEKKNRDYQPLTDEQKDALSEKEIERWEEKAKEGLLGRDPILSKVLSTMRNAMYSPVEGADGTSASPIDTLEEIGINLSNNWRDKGKLEIDEDKLKAMIATDLTKVAEVFNKSTSTLAADDDSDTTESSIKFAQSGVADRIYERLEASMKELSSQALKGSQSVIGKQLTALDTRIDAFEDRLINIEDRYWRQFTAMEKAIQQSNSQSSWLMQQFGG